MLNTSNKQSSQSQKSKPAIRAYLGGSFDPVHDGHLQMALYVYECLLPIAKQQQRALHVSLLPNARSPFKQHSTNPAHRLAMLKLATQNTPLEVNELELWQTPPVYTIDSVTTLRAHHPQDSLIFMMGMDSARSLEKWKDGLTLTDYVNLWVFNRNDPVNINKNVFENNMPTQLQSQLPTSLHPFVVDSIAKLLTPNTQSSADSSVLKNRYQGHIYIDSRAIAAVSSTQIRQQLQQASMSLDIKHATQTQIASAVPINDIMSHPKANPATKWLNPAVYQYIIAHQLYSAAQFR
ncbi:MAG: nicotinate-nicotinamide nucleotide adenylyltransferase [Psychrobacter sp.]|nr:nicotinate-nicotinamide nucleotide adenylyltransferase [Psychrobacter sp.]